MDLSTPCHRPAAYRVPLITSRKHTPCTPYYAMAAGEGGDGELPATVGDNEGTRTTAMIRGVGPSICKDPRSVGPTQSRVPQMS